MTTATKAPATRRDVVNPNNVTEQQHVDAIRRLATETQQIELRTEWFSRSKQADHQTASTMVESVQANEKAMSIKKRLLSSNHPKIKELNAARTALQKWRDAYTIVKAAPCDNDEEIRISAGVRLIRNADIVAFEDGFRRHRDEVISAARTVDQYLTAGYTDEKGNYWDPILEMERRALGASFNAKDYPESLASEIQIHDPVYTPYAPSVLLPPAVLERERQRIANELDKTLETVVERLGAQLDSTFASIAGLLANSETIHPRTDSEFYQYDGADIVDKLVRNGQVILTISKEQEDGKKLRVTLPAVPEEEFIATFRPMKSDRRKVVRTASLDNFFEQLENFRRVKTMLGAHGTAIDQALDSLKDVLMRPGSSDAVAREIKNSVTFRQTLADQLTLARNQIIDRVENVVAVRRRLAVGGGVPPIQ